jgi:hypothetical protein
MEGARQLFRQHPDVSPSGKISILGSARCNEERLRAYVNRRNPAAPEVEGLYLRTGEKYGIRGDVAFCQAVYDTRAWTKEAASAAAPWYSLSAIAADRRDGPTGTAAPSVSQRAEPQVELHIQLLYAFATSRPLPLDTPVPASRIEQLERAGWRGNIVYWEDLNGKWLVPGNKYGQDVVAIWKTMLDWRGKGDVFMGETEEALLPDGKRNSRGTSTGPVSVDWSAASSEDMSWLNGQGMLPAPAPHPDRKVTWAELATLLRKMGDKP